MKTNLFNVLMAMMLTLGFSKIKCCVVLQIAADVSQGLTALIFKVELYFQDGCSRFPRKVGKTYKINLAASHRAVTFNSDCFHYQ
jgi:hypothetical protein